MDTVTISFDLLLVAPSAAYLLGVVVMMFATPKVDKNAQPYSEVAFGAWVVLTMLAVLMLLAGLGHGFYLGVT